MARYIPTCFLPIIDSLYVVRAEIRSESTTSSSPRKCNIRPIWYTSSIPSVPTRDHRIPPASEFLRSRNTQILLLATSRFIHRIVPYFPVNGEFTQNRQVDN